MIKLTPIEKDFLLNNLELANFDKNIIKTSNYIDDNFADKLRDLCIDKFDSCGYDENYDLSKIGKELISVIDKLFIG